MVNERKKKKKKNRADDVNWLQLTILVQPLFGGSVCVGYMGIM